MKQSTFIGGIVAALVIGLAVGYFVPHASGATSTPNRTGGGTGSFARGAFGRGGANGGGNGFLTGSVVSESQNTIVLKSPDGSSHNVIITPQTTVVKSVTGTLSDVHTGAALMVTGTTNSDGSISAQDIQIRSGIAGAPRQPGTAPSASSPATGG